MANRLNKLLLIPCALFSLSACELFTVPKEENVTEATEEEISQYQNAGEATYYKSDLYEMHSTIAGYFTYGRPFTIENDNKNVHIYNNLCLYEGDEFFIAKNKRRNTSVFSLPDFDYCFNLKEKEDEQYVDVDIDKGDSSVGSLFLKSGKDGEYKITFDVETKLIDIEFLKEIDTPRYDYISHCDISEIHFKKTSYKPLRENPDNKDELCILNYDVPRFASVVLDNNFGCYTRVWLDESLYNMARTFTKRELIHFSVGGNYNIFLNRKDYSVRLELNNPETASYCCYYVFSDNDPILLTEDNEHPYIFHLDNFSNLIGNGVYSSLIKFVDAFEGERGTYKYKLTPVGDNIKQYEKDYYQFTSGGTFNITVNLLEGTVSAEKLN